MNHLHNRLLAGTMALACACGVEQADAAFGLTTATDYFQVDTGAGLVFKVRRNDYGSSTQSPGDLMSLVWNGVEYQNPSRGSQINSGFDWVYDWTSAVSIDAQVVDSQTIKVTVVAGDLTHYYIARNGHPNIYMATHFLTQPNTLGLCRYIVRIPEAKLPNGPVPSDIRNTTTTIESGDIFALPDGTTRSKHYSNLRLRDWSYIGATASNAGIWMVRDNHEGGSGGPFYRSLLNQCGSDQEITYIVNYGQAQTEGFRPGILNSYTLTFNQGSAPAAVDTSWFAGLGLIGYVGNSSRGAVHGSAITNRDTRYVHTVSFSNATAQYSTDAAPIDGSFSLSGMIPGNYTMKVYKNELAVHTGSVVVNAGGDTAINPISITDDPSDVLPIWRIGDWDGTPNEFVNGDKVTTMHPSDPRMSGWNPGTYLIGSSSPATGMPCYQWKDINGSQAVQFQLTPGQVLASTIRVGITVAYAGARPNISVNSWTSPFQGSSTQPDSRSLTTGSYRGNNTTYSFSVPASALVAGTNTLWISPISGSGSTGFLSAGYSIDCIDFTNPSAVPPALAGTTIGTTGSWGNNPATMCGAALDGNLGTYFDSDLASTGWVGLDLGGPQVITGVSYVPRSGFPARMVGGVFQGSNTPDFSSGVATLFTISAQPAEGIYSGQSVADLGGYRYVRYYGPANGFCNVAEIEFYGEPTGGDTTPPAAPAGLVATESDGSVSLDWSDNSEPDLDSYIVYRSTTSGANFAPIASGLANSQYFDDSAVNGTTYYYVVTAVDNASNPSAFSTQTSATPAGPASWTQLAFDDFEAGFGRYTDGGADCSRSSGSNSPQGTWSVDLQDNDGTASAATLTNGIDVHAPGYTELQIEFSFKAVSMEAGEDFWLQYYNGTRWVTVRSYVSGTDFTNGSVYDTTVVLGETIHVFPTGMKIRFMCDASDNNDDVYIDEVRISAR